MARPIKSEPRDRQLNFSLTESEFEGIRKRAASVGMRPVHFGRDLLLGSDRKIPSAREPESNMGKLIHGQLVRLGNNLNQMVRRLHETGDPLPADLEHLLRDIRQIIARGPR
jgi:hypothetical protein